jgi:hypothetical protein
MGLFIAKKQGFWVNFSVYFISNKWFIFWQLQPARVIWGPFGQIQKILIRFQIISGPFTTANMAILIFYSRQKFFFSNKPVVYRGIYIAKKVFLLTQVY